MLGMLAPSTALAQDHWADKGSTVPAAIAQTERDLRIARALRLRRDNIREEMASCLHRQEERFLLVDADLIEFDELAESDKAVRAALMQVELRLQQAGAYFLSDEQQVVVLDRIADVGADTRRFCKYLGVEAVAKIPAHEFDYALAQLERKRASAPT